VKLENGRFLDPTFYKGPRSGFVWLGKTYELRNEGIRAMPIIVEDNCALKLEIMFISRYHL
jgi:hypothetical protein